MESLDNHTYHLVYHDIGYEHNKFTRWINSMVTPEVFAEHIEQLCELGTICSLNEAFVENKSNRPRFVIWFDDAYAGTYKYASSICREKGIVASLAVNSQFALRASCFWRCELSWLLETHTALEVSDRLLLSQHLSPGNIWNETLNQYGPEMHCRISYIFKSKSSLAERNTCHETFMDEGRIRELANNGWTICNHTANHSALVSPEGLNAFMDDFHQNKAFVQEVGGEGDTWVLPFDYGIVRKSADVHLKPLLASCKHLIRAFYFSENNNAIPRITITGHQNALTQIHRAIKPKNNSVFKRIKMLLSHFKNIKCV